MFNHSKEFKRIITQVKTPGFYPSSADLSSAIVGWQRKWQQIPETWKLSKEELLQQVYQTQKLLLTYMQIARRYCNLPLVEKDTIISDAANAVIPVLTVKAHKAINNLLKPVVLQSLWKTAAHPTFSAGEL